VVVESLRCYCGLYPLGASLQNVNPIDLMIGARLRERRVLESYNQQELAAKARMPCARLKQVELGATAVSAEELSRLSAALRVSIAYFFRDAGYKLADINAVIEPLCAPEERSLLMQAFGGIKDKALRRQVLLYVQALARTESCAQTPQVVPGPI
jgi:transcriptional regulator with XRE-family HTH domain